MRQSLAALCRAFHPDQTKDYLSEPGSADINILLAPRANLVMLRHVNI